ncbi:hypothetical protein [Terriglobus saanensis]|uniref:Uncharacterized protein n=1 Tax=Terriglobus saanensis (strain ATCC BAA-1853 / DSM 23119 / SP1PR4) TaxID=401053 RepID=E8UY95_TERSS|nr:hypothetical protein [Terriglobus saanensis]ADV80905.1 hypothetical protein AciPR4_0064 [Terriglobus saanensis SP1PR4]
MTNQESNAVKGLLKKRERCTFLLGAVPFGLFLLAGCGSGTHAAVSTPVTVSGAITPTVTVTASPAGSISMAQPLSVAVAVTSSSATPQGSVVLSSGNYASFPASISAGQAVIHVPAGLLAVGTDTLTANFTPSNVSSFNSASGTADVTVTDADAATPVVTASSVLYSTGGYGSPFRALPLASGNVLVSVTAATSGMLVFVPAAGGGLKLSCFNFVRPSFVQDGASDLGMNLTPNGAGVAATLGVDGAIFYNLSTLQTCTSTGLQVSQGPLASHQGSFDVVVTPDGKYAFVANEFGVAAGATTEGNIGVVALQYDSTGVVTTGTLLGQVSTGGQGIAGVTISPDGSRLYVTSEVAGASSKAAGTGNPVLTKSNCTEQAGVAPHDNGLLTVIDVAAAEASPSSSAIVATVNAGCTPVRAVETTDGSTLWVSARGDNRVLALSTGMLETNPDNALLGYADTGGTEPVGLRLFDGGKLLAVANSNRFEAGTTANATILSVAVPAKASVVQTIPTGLFPREITVGSDDRTLYLTNYNSGSLQVVTTTVQ